MSDRLTAANIYVDGENVRRWRPDGVNLPRLVHHVTSGLETSATQTRYFTGRLPDDHPKATDAGKYLGYLRSCGIEIHARDVARRAGGRLGEMGVDVSLGAAMIDDFSHGAQTFIVLSNDRDHQESIDALRAVAQAAQRRIRVINVTTTDRPLLRNTQHLGIRAATLERCELDQLTRRSIEQSNTYTPAPRKPETTLVALGGQRAALIADPGSLGASAVRLFGRTHLDADLIALLRGTAERMNLELGPIRIAMNTHEPWFHLDAHLYTTLFAKDCMSRHGDTVVEAIPFQYRLDVVRQHKAGLLPPIDILAQTPREKHVHTSMLRSAVNFALSGKCGAIIIASDSLEAEPIVDVVNTIARMRHTQIPVLQVHFDPHAHYQGTHEVIIDRDGYTAALEQHDRYARIPVTRSEFLRPHYADIERQLHERHPEIQTLVSNEPSITGTLVGENLYWKAFRLEEDPTTAAVIRANLVNFGIEPGRLVTLEFEADLQNYSIRYPSEQERAKDRWRAQWALENDRLWDRERLHSESVAFER